MDNIKNWCSNKENIKILFMIGMAIILLVILKIRFGGKAVHTSGSSVAGYEAEMKTPVQDSVRVDNKKMPERAPARAENVMYRGPKPPPFLKRDLFTSRNPVTKPKRKTGKVEKVNLELTATIIDGQGALAIIGNEVFGMGDMVQGLRVTSIKKNEVVLSKGKRQHVLRLKEE